MLLDEVNEIRVILNRFRHAGLIALKFTWCTVHRATEIGSQTVVILTKLHRKFWVTIKRKFPNTV